MVSKAPIGFTRSCWGCKGFKNAYGGKLDRAKKLWHCADCINKKEVAVKQEEKINWHSGKPPAVGWYRAKGKDFPWTGTYRWWDGTRWSWAAFEHESAERAGRWALKKESNGYVDRLMWSEAPTKGKP